jgi:ribosome maturation factor RimP
VFIIKFVSDSYERRGEEIMNEQLENPYETIIYELKQKRHHKANIKVEFPKKEIGHYDGIVVIIRDDSCVILDTEKKERISIPYNIITKIN